ncbi:proton-coupled zinc antiporter SLC30A2-like isoform X2 [Boleophthalmus pectinirostris]|uniref:proton-coupled zinc antiporter SLC30A2-like isoform X2 n=1 Tax=Boleophthalmus pectinirostris TaxID=150288 RepID=UPI000A1C5295|nr:proton-coupled zinc antiporter SLC30A2-like isoform X2 [Boleophthalmus pectinirostris]
METEDLEKQKLIDVQLEPHTCRSSSEETPWDSEEDFSSAEAPWSSRGVCPDLTQDLNQDLNQGLNQSTGTPGILGAGQESRRAARRKLWLACVLGLLFMAGEVIGGYLSQSLAVLTDAAHLLSDVCSVLLSLCSLWLSARSPTDTMTFGWHRAEILAMLVSVLSIWGVTAALLWAAVLRLSEGQFHIDTKIMLITSACAVLVNVLMVLILHQPGSPHSHSHSSVQSEWTQRAARGPSRGPGAHGRVQTNASVRAAFIHVLGDLLQSVGVLLAAAVIHFRPEYKAADPICTFLFSALVLWTTFPVIKDVLRVLMEACPEHVQVESVRALLLSVSGVVSVHSLRVWGLSLSLPLLSVHVITEEDSDSQQVLMRASDLLCSQFGFSNVTIQVEKLAPQTRI